MGKIITSTFSGKLSKIAGFFTLVFMILCCLTCQVQAATPQFSAGRNHTIAVLSDGTIWAWGGNIYGQLGDGTSISKTVPLQVGSGYAAVAAGYNHTVALKTDGSLWAWGDNNSGQLGNGTTNRSYIPLQVGSGFAAVAAGYNHTVALKTDGSLWAWGDNNFGQLGDGTTNRSNIPVQVGSGYAAVAAGYNHTVAQKTDGSLWAWGGNGYGQLGNGTTNSIYSPWQVGSGFAVVAAGGNHTVAVKSDDSLWAWGLDGLRQIIVPSQIGSGYAAVAAGDTVSIALKTDGTLWAWGENGYGELGNGTTKLSNFPVQVGSEYAAVAAGSYHTVALKMDGTLWAWGDNEQGQLGNETTTNSNTPVKVQFPIIANNATPIQPGFGVTDHLVLGSNNSGHKTYTFTIDTAGDVAINLKHESTYSIANSPNYFNINVYDSDEYRPNAHQYYYSAVISQDRAPLDFVRHIGLPRGVYYIEIDSGTSSSQLDYTINYQFTPGNTYEVELNDSISTANTIKSDTPYIGRFQMKSTDPDVDYYKFTVDTPGDVTINLQHAATYSLANSPNFFNITVFGIDGSGSVGNTYFYAPITSQSNQPLNFVRFIGLPKGDYYIKLSSGTNVNEIDYVLSYSLTQGANYEIELNDSIKTATEISVNSPYTGRFQLKAAGPDVDYYKLTVDVPGDFTLNLKHASAYSLQNSLNYFNLEVFDVDDFGILVNEYFASPITSHDRQALDFKKTLTLPIGTYDAAPFL
ncbi:RCC1 domain-containing protein [Citrifermentans bremense]|uniref:RCC1 domain-containing protein n=1 Tax=Citrifermentans bremense TaxID=60035 RepID=UPI0004014969|nr:hypothetical protein [Citrifermentans bremense]